MAVMPGARYEPVTGHSDGPMRSYTGIVLHCNAAESEDLHNFFQDSSGATGVSSHFQVDKAGVIWQYIDTSQQAWCQGDGNADYLSIESEGEADELATPEQVASIARILRWANVTHNVTLQLAERPGDRGFGWHGMGAAAGDPNWGHPACPGVRKNQRTEMLTAAQPEGVEDVAAISILLTPTEGEWVLFPNTGAYFHIDTPADVAALVAAGATPGGGGQLSEAFHQRLIAASNVRNA